jgi:hypothetical protein
VIGFGEKVPKARYPKILIDPAWVVLKINASAPACLDGTR